MSDADNNKLLVDDFMSFFTGNIHNYGVHTYRFTDNGKEKGDNVTVTSKLITEEQYLEHLSGIKGLGIIPIDAEGKCKFAVIDIDVYDTNLNIYIRAIERNNFPLIPFKSKSGGLHLYIFFKEKVNAQSAIDGLNALAGLLALDLFVKNKLNRLLEIFPKQGKIAEGKLGNWINLPYYDYENTRQYAMRNNEKLSLANALAYIKEKQTTLANLKTFIKDLQFRDGPPCLQSINLLNSMDENSGRNNYLFSFGVYLKKKDPDFWEQKLFEINNNLLNPLDADEIERTIISSLRKKDYAYKCEEQPCVDYCRKPVCKKREFGVGKEGGYFADLIFGKLYQIKAYEPYYEWEVKVNEKDEFKLMRFKNENEIIGQDAFLRLCFRDLHLLPIKIKQAEWFKLINQALSDIEIKVVEKEYDASPMSLLKELIKEFLSNRARAATKDQILNKRVYFNEENKHYYFRSIDMSDFIWGVKNFKYYGPGELHGFLRDFNARPIRIMSESKRQIRVYEITEDDVNKISEINNVPFKADLKENDEAF